MRAAPLRPAVATLLAAVLAGCGGEGTSGDGRDLFHATRAFEDLRAQVEIGPRPAGSRGGGEVVRLIAGQLREAGARDVGVQSPHANVVGTIPGRAPGAVVVGAHHDTKDAIPGFVGANDGASGVAVVLELARALRAPLEGPSVYLALFDAEEPRGDRDFALDGARGSRQYVRLAAAGGRDGSPALRRVRAMVLFDMVGDCDLEVPRETGYSDPELHALFAAASEDADGGTEPFTGTTTPIGDDHVPFAEAGVPTVDLIDFTFGSDTSPGPYWHTPEDTLDVVCASSLDAVGEAAVRAVPRIR